MQTIILIALGAFFITSTLFLALYVIINNKYKKEHKTNTELVSKFYLLSKSINRLKDELSTKRVGYYQSNITLKENSDSPSGDVYVYNIHVKELDKYTNGMSKIKIIDIEIVSGFSPNKYEWVKECARNTFSTIRKTADIEWLESEETTKEQRREKLEKLKDLESKL